MTDDELRAFAFAAIKAAAVDFAQRRATLTAAASRATTIVLGAAGVGDASPRETASERWRRENAAALVQMAELERQGKGRSAARTVAKRFAVDRHDPIELYNLTQRFRRHWRAQK